jgi:tRNA pseudouridine55 synthase
VTSHDVVAAARRALRERRIGHAGTLDPFATGLLVLMVGRATRLLPYMDGEPKRYEAVIRFGRETDTADLHGAVTATGAVPDYADVLAALPALTGELDQIPPVYSAKRIDGQRAYDLARAGVEVEMRPSRVRVDAWEPRGWESPDFAATITCGGGTYIRSLARDLGRLVGSAAHLVALRRAQSGPFFVRDATPLDAMREGRFTLLPPRAALSGVAEESLAPGDVTRVARGIAIAATVPGARAALVNAANGALVAYAERRDNLWQPRVVMRPADEV